MESARKYFISNDDLEIGRFVFLFQVSFFFEESSLYSITPLLALLDWFLSPVSRKGKIRPNPNSFHAS